MKNKIIISIVVVILLVTGFNIFSRPIDTTPIKIGVILPLSGDLAFIGEPAKRGAEMALENFKDTKHKYELIFEDDQFDGKKAITAAQKLISVDKVNVLVTFGSSGGNSVKPLAETNRILHFAVASDQNIADGKYNFNHWTSPKEEVTAMVTELIKRNIKNVSILTVNQDGMISTYNELIKQLSDNKIDVVVDEKFNPGTTDFKTLLTKVKINLPEMIIMLNYTPEMDILGKQIKDLGITVPLTSIEGFDGATRPELFSGFWYVSSSEPSKQFLTDFKNKFGIVAGLGTGNVYDVASLIITATENIRGSVTAEKIASELLKIKDFTGSMGNVSINQTGSVISKAVIKTIK